MPPEDQSALGQPPAAPTDPTSSDGGAAPTPAPAGGTFTAENWRDALGEEYRKEPSLEHFKTMDDLAKSYVHAQKMIGKDKVVIPDAKFATDKEWSAFYQKLGLPGDAKDYKLDAPKLGDGQTLDEDFMNSFKEEAFKMNILPGQAQKLANWFAGKEAEAMAGARQHQLAEVQKGLDAYKAQVGQAFDKKVLYANRVLSKFGGDEATKWIASNPSIGSNPHMIEMLAKLGEHLYSEDTFEGQERVQGAMSPTEAQAKINEVMSDANHAYFNGSHPKHQEAVAYMQKLFGFVTG